MIYYIFPDLLEKKQNNTKHFEHIMIYIFPMISYDIYIIVCRTLLTLCVNVSKSFKILVKCTFLRQVLFRL